VIVADFGTAPIRVPRWQVQPPPPLHPQPRRPRRDCKRGILCLIHLKLAEKETALWGQNVSAVAVHTGRELVWADACNDLKVCAGGDRTTGRVELWTEPSPVLYVGIPMRPGERKTV